MIRELLQRETNALVSGKENTVYLTGKVEMSRNYELKGGFQSNVKL